MKISLILTTCDRPALFFSCWASAQVASEFAKVRGLSTEIIVVDEGKQPVGPQPNVDTYITRPTRGAWGAFAKDDGIAAATGDYVCFWDDDNVFFPHALVAMKKAVIGADVGVVPSYIIHHPNDVEILPGLWGGKFVESKVDTINFCVRTELAKGHLWSATITDRCTDYNWIRRVVADPQCKDVSLSSQPPIGIVIPWSLHTKGIS